MTPTAEIERIVRAVLAELTASPQMAPAETPRETASGPESGVCPAAAEGELSLDARLITMAEVAGRLEGVRRVVVSPQEVTDDRARDIAKELRRRIEGELQYPSTIKITVIREARYTETAT